jgi:hypothetical protein
MHQLKPSITDRLNRKNLQISFMEQKNIQLSAKILSSEAYIKGHLKKEGKCEMELVRAVTDSQGETVAEITALPYIAAKENRKV